MNRSITSSFLDIPCRWQLTNILLIAFTFSLSGCTTTQGSSGQATAEQVADPYENVNRKIYAFNDDVDDYVAKPISDAYKFITPQFMQTGVSNFFNNLQTINVVLNDVLQAKFSQSAEDTGRFLMNSTLGMAGLFDVAKTVGLQANDEDFEQTLAVWGVPQGSYLVLPLLGPITTRGIPGAVFDTAANPVNYVGAPVQIISLINKRANAEGSLRFIDEAALDPYVFTRESFLQWRNHLASDGKTETTSPDLDPDLLGDDDTAAPTKTDSNVAVEKQKITSESKPSPLIDNKQSKTLPLPPTDSTSKK
ncbi:MAG: VacJ family lipoprotein [Methyloglobulus sp.]|nr:VacJ family lipoprotein [Methyloglobulus sp.]